MKKILLIMMALVAVALYHPQAESATASKHRALFPAFGGASGSFTTNYPDLFPSNPDIEFAFPLGLTIGYLSDYFFGIGNEKHAFSFDLYYSGSSSALEFQAQGNTPGSDVNILLTKGLTSNALNFGYRYHFAGVSRSTGYLGAGLLYRSLSLESDDPEFSNAGTGASISANFEPEEPIKVRAGVTLAVTAGYEWRLRRNSTVMGLHLMYAPPRDYGDIQNLGGPTLGYSVGGAVN